MGKDDRAKLYPRCGRLNPDGLAALARADDYEQVKAVAEYYAVRDFKYENFNERLLIIKLPYAEKKSLNFSIR